MHELRPAGSAPRNSDDAVRVAQIAARQWGVVAWWQLLQCGLGRATVSRWVRAQRLHRIHPGVYAVGYPALCRNGRLTAALFYAGAGAALSHVTAAWWWGLLAYEPNRIHVSALHRRRNVDHVRLHRPRALKRTWHKRLPVTPVAQTLLDLAATAPFKAVRRALAEAEYRRLVTLDDVEAVLGRGCPGSATLRGALDRHRPQLARTFSVLEERFLALCEQHDISVPEVNVEVAGLVVDALWRRQRVIVELDGHGAHATPTAVERDRRRELALRAAGFQVLRYTWQQITQEPKTVVADLSRHLSSDTPAHERRQPWHD